MCPWLWLWLRSCTSLLSLWPWFVPPRSRSAAVSFASRFVGGCSHGRPRLSGPVQAENVDCIDESRRKRYGVEVTAETQQMVQLELIKFLHQNKEFLPIYFLPDVRCHLT